MMEMPAYHRFFQENDFFIFIKLFVMNLLWTRVAAYQVMLVYRNERLVRVLTEGRHWIPLNCKVYRYKTDEPLQITAQINKFLKEPVLRDALDVIEVRDDQIVIQYRDQIYNSTLYPGRYAYWKGSPYIYTRTVCDTTEVEVPESVPRWLLAAGHLSDKVLTMRIEANEMGLLYVSGTLTKTLGPGTYYYWKNANTLQLLKADMRKQQLEISGQEILTKDKAAIRINVQAQYVIADVVRAVGYTKDYAKQLYVLLQLAVREYIGTLSLDEILMRKEDAQPAILAQIAEQVSAIGVELISCGIRDIILPGDVKDIMNQVLIAEKKAQANVIMRREETASTRSLLNTAKLLDENPMLYKLKELEYVEKIAEKINSISVSGGTQIVDQLRQILISGK